MKSASKKSWLPKGNKGGWTMRQSRTGRFVTVSEAEKKPSTTSVSRKIDLPNGDSITKLRRDVMDKALGRDGSRKR
jgi:hypothetical protein